MFHVSFGTPLIKGWVSRKFNHLLKMGGSLIVNTNFQRTMAMLVGNILCPACTSKPNLNANLLNSNQFLCSIKILYLQRSLNSSSSRSISCTSSGSLFCMAFTESHLINFRPLTNSARVNLHICSASNFQARISILKSSGGMFKSLQNWSIPSANMASSSSSLQCSKRMFTC